MVRTPLYLDTEFTGLHQYTTLISLALCDDQGRSLYAEFRDYDQDQCDAWIHENVLSQTLWLKEKGVQTKQLDAMVVHDKESTMVLGSSDQIREQVADWLSAYDGSIEVWADCLAFDWVLFCQLFGGAFGLPSSVFYMPNDFATALRVAGMDPDLDRVAFAGLDHDVRRHNALFDAQVLKTGVQKLRRLTRMDESDCNDYRST